jgi:hypothetical protein
MRPVRPPNAWRGASRPERKGPDGAAGSCRPCAGGGRWLVADSLPRPIRGTNGVLSPLSPRRGPVGSLFLFWRAAVKPDGRRGPFSSAWPPRGPMGLFLLRCPPQGSSRTLLPRRHRSSLDAAAGEGEDKLRPSMLLPRDAVVRARCHASLVADEPAARPRPAVGPPSASPASSEIRRRRFVG